MVFAYFSYEGETLWDRRLRLEREGEPDEQSDRRPCRRLLADKQAESEIIGLEGRPLSPSTWRLVQECSAPVCVSRSGHDASRMGKVSKQLLESLVSSFDCARCRLVNRRRYFKVCEINGIVPEGDADV